MTFAERMRKLLTFNKMWIFDRVVWTFVSKILGAWIFIVGIILFLEIVGRVGWKVNYKQLHLATKSIWGFDPILEQIAWKCKIDCLQERGIKWRFCSKFSWCSISAATISPFPIQCNLFVIPSPPFFPNSFPIDCLPFKWRLFNFSKLLHFFSFWDFKHFCQYI